MSVPNRATSETRNAITPHWAGLRTFSGSMAGGTGSCCALAASSDSTFSPVSFTAAPSFLVLPVGVVGMFQVPQRPSAVDGRRLIEVIRWRRRGRHPLQRPGVPRIVAGRFAILVGPDDVDDKDGETRHLDERPERGQLVEEHPGTIRLVGVDASRHAEHP